ncbi:ATP-binding protein [Geothrix sp. 21YS21S-2]|uniref:ATP-binding protein n=1 Tax=Geothrix sp. 21YS21S-2 TaxID=3068893 RepID=UPI0027B914CD|nr:ATP-binding protein [Geothrix sp. 21YS21S-2]
MAARRACLGHGLRAWSQRRRNEDTKEILQVKLLQAQKLEVVGRLAGGIAHDFNNMLCIILGCADLALGLAEPGGQIHASLHEILTAARHSSNLTGQLLAFARKQEVVPRLLDLNTTVEGMLSILKRLIGEEIRLEWQPLPSVWPVRMDPAQVEQVLANLCVNARDAIVGPGTIRVETRNVTFGTDPCAPQTSTGPGDYVVLAVCDNGAGIDPSVIKQIFEPFFTTKAAGKGTGLGLANIHGILKQNGGFIEVDSAPGAGSQFTAYFPRAMRGPEYSWLPKADQVARGRGELLLVVDDNESLRSATCEALRSLGYTVLEADSPGEALKHAKISLNEIALLITDMIMPIMNGQELAKQLRSAKPGLGCLFVSGCPEPLAYGQGLFPEKAGFLQKPYSFRDLSSRVRGLLDAE